MTNQLEVKSKYRRRLNSKLTANLGKSCEKVYPADKTKNKETTETKTQLFSCSICFSRSVSTKTQHK